MAAARDLSFDGTQTKLGEALQRAKDEFAGLPLAGLVMVTDGADTEESSIQESLLGLRASQIPVFTVGVGKEALGRDIQISRVSTPRKVLKGTNLSVDVIVSQTGFRGTTVPLNVEDSGRILSSQQVPLTNDGEPTTVKVHFTANEAGPRNIRFRIPNQEGEEIAENNVRRTWCSTYRIARRRFCSSTASRTSKSSSSAGRLPTIRTCSSCCCSARRRRSSSASWWTAATSLPQDFPRRAMSCSRIAG